MHSKTLLSSSLKIIMTIIIVGVIVVAVVIDRLNAINFYLLSSIDICGFYWVNYINSYLFIFCATHLHT